MDLSQLFHDLVHRKGIVTSRLELLEIIIAAEDLFYADTPENRLLFLQLLTDNG